MLRATKVALALAIVVSTPVIILAQDRALITGDVEDRQDTPVSGVQVFLRNDSLRIERSTTTNSDGYYFFAEVVPAEGYVVTTTGPGFTFAPASVKFDIEVGEARHILPSFVAEKLSAPVSGLQRHGQSPMALDSQASYPNRRSALLPIAWLVEGKVVTAARPFAVRGIGNSL
ncbi:MAG TPA: carboxypeptidase regulatory-like domain-containing protein [Candidatus Methylomirabilis sp.]|nr:carboxypeptidase regulatory-like domain-containing protein [Candidatus Methylomirabilis sp.]